MDRHVVAAVHADRRRSSASDLSSRSTRKVRRALERLTDPQVQVIPPNCEWCGATHNPWGAHARKGATVYEIWVDETGLVESALTIGRDAGAPEREALRQFARQLERLVTEECVSALGQPTVFLQLDADSGLGYGPLFAPEHLHRPLSELIDLARNDLSLRP